MRAKAAVKIAATRTTTQKLSLLDSELLIYRMMPLISP
jgi:hypothetical protein